VFIKTSRELLKCHSTPDEIAELDLPKLTGFLELRSRRCFGQSHAERISKSTTKSRNSRTSTSGCNRNSLATLGSPNLLGLDPRTAVWSELQVGLSGLSWL